MPSSIKIHSKASAFGRLSKSDRPRTKLQQHSFNAQSQTKARYHSTRPSYTPEIEQSHILTHSIAYLHHHTTPQTTPGFFRQNSLKPPASTQPLYSLCIRVPSTRKKAVVV